MEDLDWVAIERRAKRERAAEMGRLMEAGWRWLRSAWCRALEGPRAPGAATRCGAQ